jgi:glutamate dehydrogenase/leucine dehydrogenase
MALSTGMLDHPDFDHHESVTFVTDRASGLRAVIAIHSTALGPALGGTRWHAYPDSAAALTDALRLSQGMTYKAAVAGLDLGGGKAVVLADGIVDREAALLAYGRAVEALGGHYITAEDVGTTTADMDALRAVTDHVGGVSPALGGSGDPSPCTARGVMAAMRAAAHHCFGSSSLEGRHVTVSGVGKVGRALVGLLAEAGAKLTVADVSSAAIDRLNREVAVPVHVVDVGDAHRTGCDIFAPCALGAVLNPATIAELDCSAVVGSANNELATPACGDLLTARGIVYVPDYVANAGGLIQVAGDITGRDRSAVAAQVDNIEGTVAQLLQQAAAEGISTAEAADRLALRRLGRAG